MKAWICWDEIYRNKILSYHTWGCYTVRIWILNLLCDTKVPAPCLDFCSSFLLVTKKFCCLPEQKKGFSNEWEKTKFDRVTSSFSCCFHFLTDLCSMTSRFCHWKEINSPGRWKAQKGLMFWSCSLVSASLFVPWFYPARILFLPGK